MTNRYPAKARLSPPRSRPIRRYAALSIALALLSGCVSEAALRGRERPQDNLTSSDSERSNFGTVGHSSWIGQSESALIQALGRPSITLSVPSGTAHVYTGTTECKDTYLVNHANRVVGYYCR